MKFWQAVKALDEGKKVFCDVWKKGDPEAKPIHREELSSYLSGLSEAELDDIFFEAEWELVE